MLVASVLAAMRQAVAAAQSDPATHFPSRPPAPTCSKKSSLCLKESVSPPNTQALRPLSRCSPQPMQQQSFTSDAAMQGRGPGGSTIGTPDEAATRPHQDADKPDASQEFHMQPCSQSGSVSAGSRVQPGSSFPGSFLGLEAPATVARLREAIGGPSIAAMLRNAAGLSPAGPCSTDDWEFV